MREIKLGEKINIGGNTFLIDSITQIRTTPNYVVSSCHEVTSVDIKGLLIKD